MDEPKYVLVREDEYEAIERCIKALRKLIAVQLGTMTMLSPSGIEARKAIEALDQVTETVVIYERKD